jgi:hypothetical protein
MTTTDSPPDAESGAQHSPRLADVLARKRPVTKTVRLPAADGGELTFTFRALGRKAWEELGREHAPKPEQVREYRKRQLDAGTPEHALQALPYDAETYPPALFAAGCVEPGLTHEEARDLWESDVLSFAELATLLAAAQAANTDSSTVSLGAAPPAPTARKATATKGATRPRRTAGTTRAKAS